MQAMIHQPELKVKLAFKFWWILTEQTSHMLLCSEARKKFGCILHINIHSYK